MTTLAALWCELWARPVTARRPIDSYFVASELKKLGGCQGANGMRVRIKETGEIVGVPDSPTVQLMIKTGHIEPIVEATPAPAPKFGQWVPPKTPAHWTLQEEVSSGHLLICWTCATCRQGGRFMGVRPEAVNKLRAWHCGHEGGESVPRPIAERYAALPESKRSLGLFIEATGAGVAENKRQAQEIADRKERAERHRVTRHSARCDAELFEE